VVAVVVSEMKVEIIHPKVIERRDNPVKFIRNNAAKHIIEELEKFKKKIPKRGLNNKVSMFRWRITDYPDTMPFGRNDSIPELPTLPRRMNELRWHIPFLPPQMVAIGISADDFDEEKTRTLLNECFELLSNLYINLDSVTVVDKEQIERWKRLIQNKRKYLMTTAKMLGIIQEGEFKELALC